MLKEDGPLGFAALFTADGDTDADVRDVDALANSSEPDSSAAKIKKSPRGSKEQKKLIIRVFGRGETLNALVADINREIELIRAKEKEEHYARHKKPLDATATITTTDEDDDTYQPKLLYVVEKRDECPASPNAKRFERKRSGQKHQTLSPLRVWHAESEGEDSSSHARRF